MKDRDFIGALKGLVCCEGEEIPAQARWKNHLSKKKVEVTEGVYIFLT